MKVIWFFIGLFSASFALYFDNQWIEFKAKHNKNYDPINDMVKYTRFLSNKAFIDIHNRQYNSGRVQYKLGMNQYGDWTHWEYLQLIQGRKFPGFQPIPTANPGPVDPPTTQQPPEAIDWRNFGAVHPVGDQGLTCSAGWAFASIAALEGQTFRSTGKLPPPLSAQNLIDCVPSAGCKTGTPANAFEHIRKEQNINTAQSYPYRGIKSDCQYNPDNIGATCASFEKLPLGDENYMKTIVGVLGPVASCIDASRFSYMFYESGIYNDQTCSSSISSCTHYVAIVGYGSDSQGSYWIVKNSFGTTWGENGYMRVARNANNRCGLATFAHYPIV